MTLTAKALVQDKFWIIEENGQKVGTLQKKEVNGWIFLGKEKKEKFETQEELVKKFGDIFTAQPNVTTSTESEEPAQHEVHGYPVNQKPFNPVFDVQKQIPIYGKTPKSKSLFGAGYYIIQFPKGWRKAYCPKLITLQRYPYKGPMKSKIEMQQLLNEANKDFVPTYENDKNNISSDI